MSGSVRTPHGKMIACVCDCARCASAPGLMVHCSMCAMGRWRDSLVHRHEYINAYEMWALIRARSLGRRGFAILYSHASTDVYPDLVADERFAFRIAAHSHAQSVCRAGGFEYEVMEDIDGKWLSVHGETCAQVIARRWETRKSESKART